MCGIALDVPPTAPQWACRRARRGSGRLDGCVLVRVHVQSIARSACALLECWKLRNGQIGPATQATSASVSSHWLSRTGSLPSAPSHVPPAAPPPVAAAAGGLTGVGGGADMTGRRGVRFARRFGGHQAEPIFFLALRSLGLCVCSLPLAVRDASAATVLTLISLLSLSHPFSLST